MCNSCCTSLPPKTILSVFLPYSFVLPYKRKTKGIRRGKESDNERCSIEPTQALGTWGTFVGIFAKGGELWRGMRFGSRRSFVILQPKQNYPKSVNRPTFQSISLFLGLFMPYQHFLCSMMLPGLGIASKLSLHLKITLLPFGRDVPSKITLLPFGRDVILGNVRHLVHIAVVQ